MTITIQQLRDLVTDYWPSYRANIDPMWRSYLCRYTYDDMKAVLSNHRASCPDETKPVWKLVYRDLCGGSDGGTTLLSTILAGVRADHRKRGTKGIEHWSDADSFQDFMRAQTDYIVCDLDGKAKPDPGGRRSRLAACERYNVTGRLLRDLREKSVDVPDWLEQLCVPAPPVPPMDKPDYLKKGWDKEPRAATPRAEEVSG